MWIKCQPAYGQQHILNSNLIINIWTVCNSPNEFEIRALTIDGNSGSDWKTIGVYSENQVQEVINTLFEAMDLDVNTFEMPDAEETPNED